MISEHKIVFVQEREGRGRTLKIGGLMCVTRIADDCTYAFHMVPVDYDTTPGYYVLHSTYS